MILAHRVSLESLLRCAAVILISQGLAVPPTRSTPDPETAARPAVDDVELERSAANRCLSGINAVGARRIDA
ncbi:MAG TPA: hypothetical protein VEX41_03380 [Candidatus Eisenbacteria bacterium]|nr:hypothetical protein [Candidatus Eisenbacteria bacterium]